MIFIYRRVSTVEQASDDRTSLGAQERICRGIAMAHGELNPVIFTDAGISGSVPIGQRPAGAQLLSLAQRGDIVVASKLDRMFRDIVDAFDTAKRFKESGIDLVLADISHEPITGHGLGKVMFGVMAVFADFEKDRIAARMHEGREGKKARGGHIGGDAPYGWTKIGRGRDATLVENDAEQDIIAQILALHAETGSLNRTSILLLNRGIKGREGAFNREQIRRIVRRAIPTPAMEGFNGLSRS